jgi:predicted MFS family arabinose efflux permease
MMHCADRGAFGASTSKARRAVSLCFLLNGALIASFVPHIPEIKARLTLSDGQLGWLLLAMAAGAIAALPAAGGLVARWGSRAVTWVSAAALSLSVMPPVLGPGVVATAVALSVLGACNATLDVAMNAQGILVEGAYRRPIMSSFHALFSLGGLAGAGGASVAMAAGMSAPSHMLAVAGLSLAVVGIARNALLPSERRPARDPMLVWPPAPLLGLGCLTFCALLAEGAVGDWSAVYLRDALGTTPAFAAMGFAIFSLAMALGRLAGDGLARRLGPARLLQLSGFIAAIGLAASLVRGTATASLVGFGLVGLGVANLIPVLFSAAGRTPGIASGTALAAVATTGYFGFLAGPPLIGLAAEAAGLPAALGVVCVACAVVACGAPFLLASRPAPIAHDAGEASLSTTEVTHG